MPGPSHGTGTRFSGRAQGREVPGKSAGPRTAAQLLPDQHAVEQPLPLRPPQLRVVARLGRPQPAPSPRRTRAERECVCVCVSSEVEERQRQRQTEIDRDKERRRARNRDTETQRDRERQRHRDTEE